MNATLPLGLLLARHISSQQTGHDCDPNFAPQLLYPLARWVLDIPPNVAPSAGLGLPLCRDCKGRSNLFEIHVELRVGFAVEIFNLLPWGRLQLMREVEQKNVCDGLWICKVKDGYTYARVEEGHRGRQPLVEGHLWIVV